MAASTNSERESEEKAADSSSLDLLSANFDPLEALSNLNATVNLPCPEVQPLDNLAQYEAIVKGTASERAQTARREQRSCEGSAFGEEQAVVSDPVRGPADANESSGHKATKQVRTVVKFMKEPHLTPFVLLKECVQDGSQVQVWTRHIAGLRGIAEGVLLLFDHHFNVVLQDAWEVFVPFKPQGRQRKRPKRIRKGKNRQHMTEEHSGESCTTGGQLLGVSKRWTGQSNQECPSIAEDISSDPAIDRHIGAPLVLDPPVETIALSSSSDSEIKARTDDSEIEEESCKNDSSCKKTERELMGRLCRHSQHSSSVDQSGEELCASQRYPPECRGLLKLFAAHNQCGSSTTRAPPFWQHSELLFIRGDNVVLVARSCK